MAAPVQPIIVIKKKGGHGGHHGGAWKVAYADFVTAMMALFIVLWLMHASPEVQRAVGGYFKDPKGRGSQTGTNLAGAGMGVTINKQNVEQLKEKLQQSIQNRPEFQKLKNNIEMTITAEGLRIELVESEKGIFFESGQPAPTGTGSSLLVKLAQELSKLDSPVMLEGHTDSQGYGKAEYSNWELSADRANAARRIMQSSGLKATQVSQVRGFADQQLRLPDKPSDASNRRVSIIVQFPQGESAGSEPQKQQAGKGRTPAHEAPNTVGEKHSAVESKENGGADNSAKAKSEPSPSTTHAESGKKEGPKSDSSQKHS